MPNRAATLREWGRRCWATLRRRRSDSDLQPELQAHLDLAAEAPRRGNHDAGSGRREVLMRAGSVSHAMDALRDQRSLSLLDALMADVMFGWRQLNKRRAVSVAAVLSLGLAIGAAAAAIRLIDAVLVRSLPVDRPERLFAVAITFVDAAARSRGSGDADPRADGRGPSCGVSSGDSRRPHRSGRDAANRLSR